MKNVFTRYLACGLLVVATTLAPAQEGEEELSPQVSETTAVEEGTSPSAVTEPEVTAPPPSEVVPPPTVQPTTPPPPQKPQRTSRDLDRAFTGIGSSKMGVGSRSLKLSGKGRRKKKEDGWRWTISVGITTRDGNKEIRRLDSSVETERDTGKLFLWGKLAARYGETDNVKDTDEIEGAARAERILFERNYAALDLNVLHDVIAELDYRARANVSLGRRWIQSSRFILATEAGPGYVRERKEEQIEDYAAGRVAQSMEWLVNESVLLRQSVEYIGSLEDRDVYFVNAGGELEVLLTETLRLRFQVENKYDNAPAKERERNELTTRSLLAWTF